MNDRMNQMCATVNVCLEEEDDDGRNEAGVS